MHDDVSLKKAANKAMRISAVMYVLVKQVFYMTLFESIYWIPRTIASVFVLFFAFGLTYKNKLPKTIISWLVPLSFALTEIILVASFGGDRLTYVFLIGCALLSLLYMDLKGLIISTAGSCAAAALCLFAFRFTLIGEAYEFTDDVFNFAGVVVVDIIICLIGRFSIGTLAKSKQDAENALREAQAANNAKSAFLATMSHEIRTPMNAIIGITQIQMQNKDMPEEYATAFEKINNSGNSLLGIINDILDLSKIETGKLELHPAVYDLPNLISDAMQLNAVRIGAKPIKFELEIDENLPVSYYGDELRIKQILNNLLSNAIKYTDKGHVKLSVFSKEDASDALLPSGNSSDYHDYHLSVTERPRRDTVNIIFTVEDTGHGMRAEDMERLFTEYLRLNLETTRSIEGTGLGLNITKQLLELMGGDIDVTSEFGKGSTFTVTLNQKIVNDNPIGHEIAEKLRSFSFVDNKTKDRRSRIRNPMPYGRVLVVDDVESNLYVTEGLLAQYKLKVETVTSGFKAINIVEDGNTYDIIFMDHMMPRMDGIETTKKLRDMGYNGVIIALTANALTGNDKLFTDNGFNGFLSKPIDIRRLDSVLNEHIRSKYPEEAAKYDRRKAQHVDDSGIKPLSPKMLELFLTEAEKAVASLKEARSSDDIQLFVAAIHAIKPALSNIGKQDAYKTASELENAGRHGDDKIVSEKAEIFIETLENIIKELYTTRDLNLMSQEA